MSLPLSAVSWFVVNEPTLPGSVGAVRVYRRAGVCEELPRESVERPVRDPRAPPDPYPPSPADLPVPEFAVDGCSVLAANAVVQTRDLLLTKLHPRVTEELLREELSVFGRVRDLRMISNASGEPLHAALVELDSEEQALAAVTRFRERTLMGQRCTCVLDERRQLYAAMLADNGHLVSEPTDYVLVDPAQRIAVCMRRPRTSTGHGQLYGDVAGGDVSQTGVRADASAVRADAPASATLSRPTSQFDVASAALASQTSSMAALDRDDVAMDIDDQFSSVNISSAQLLQTLRNPGAAARAAAAPSGRAGPATPQASIRPPEPIRPSSSSASLPRPASTGSVHEQQPPVPYTQHQHQHQHQYPPPPPHVQPYQQQQRAPYPSYQPPPPQQQQQQQQQSYAGARLSAPGAPSYSQGSDPWRDRMRYDSGGSRPDDSARSNWGPAGPSSYGAPRAAAQASYQQPPGSHGSAPQYRGGPQSNGPYGSAQQPQQYQHQQYAQQPPPQPYARSWQQQQQPVVPPAPPAVPAALPPPPPPQPRYPATSGDAGAPASGSSVDALGFGRRTVPAWERNRAARQQQQQQTVAPAPYGDARHQQPPAPSYASGAGAPAPAYAQPQLHQNGFSHAAGGGGTHTGVAPVAPALALAASSGAVQPAGAPAPAVPAAPVPAAPAPAWQVPAHASVPPRPSVQTPQTQGAAVAQAAATASTPRQAPPAAGVGSGPRTPAAAGARDRFTFSFGTGGTARQCLLVHCSGTAMYAALSALLADNQLTVSAVEYDPVRECFCVSFPEQLLMTTAFYAFANKRIELVGLDDKPVRVTVGKHVFGTATSMLDATAGAAASDAASAGAPVAGPYDSWSSLPVASARASKATGASSSSSAAVPAAAPERWSAPKKRHRFVSDDTDSESEASQTQAAREKSASATTPTTPSGNATQTLSEALGASLASASTAAASSAPSAARKAGAKPRAPRSAEPKGAAKRRNAAATAAPGESAAGTAEKRRAVSKSAARERERERERAADADAATAMDVDGSTEPETAPEYDTTVQAIEAALPVMIGGGVRIEESNEDDVWLDLLLRSRNFVGLVNRVCEGPRAASDVRDADATAAADEPAPSRRRSAANANSTCRRALPFARLSEAERLHGRAKESDIVAVTAASAAGTSTRSLPGTASSASRGIVRSKERRARAGQEVSTAFSLDTRTLLALHEARLVSFGKSPIHNWGLFARKPVVSGQLIVEYVGELVRPRVADLREKRYLSRGNGSSYLFRLDNDIVIDATVAGNDARFANHSCDPNADTEIIAVRGDDGQLHRKVIMYALRNISPSEEITVNYRFEEEDGKIPCHCGAKTCKGSLN